MATWKEAIQDVLAQNGGAMHYAAIAEKVASLNLLSVGANPAASAAAILSQNIGPDAPFERVGVGLYALKAELRPEPQAVVQEAEAGAEQSETGALRAFGMFWQRELVHWTPTRPKLFGRQSEGALQVDFGGQIGVYLLHDRDRVIYVGRASDLLVSRLRAHTTDRMGGRWDRFSWFGLYGVKEDGTLLEDTVPWSQTVVIETLEALLIESLEPPQNRRRGDNFAAVEYLQGTGPEIERVEQQKFLAVVADRIRRP